MRKALFLLIACFLISFPTMTQPARLIVRADDMGSSHAANEAILKTCKEGIVTSVEIMVTTPWFPEAVKMLNENPGIDVGLHLTLTSEWENIKWRPLTDCPSLVDKNGFFFPMIYPNKNYPGQAILENNWKIADIEKEFRAQIELALSNIPRISHLSAHMGCGGFSPEVSELTTRLAKEYKIDNELYGLQVEYAGYDGPSKTSAEKVQAFLSMLNKLEQDKTYIFVDHPGLDNAELKAVYHIGYEQVSVDRQGVTDVLTNEKVKNLIREKGILLLSYKEVTGKQ
jgi:predicted glycoside hydrolase/deacetylase ChbG (UPF0249 family)